MAANPQPALSGFARALVQHGRLSEADAIACTRQGTEGANAFIFESAERGLISIASLARFAADTFGYPLLDIAAFDKSMLSADAVDRKLMQKHQVVALAQRQNRITLALADPSNMRVLDEIRFQTGLQLDLVIAEADKLKRLVETLSESATDKLKELNSDNFDMGLLKLETQGESREEVEDTSEVDDAPVVRFIQKVLIDAIAEGASVRRTRTKRSTLSGTFTRAKCSPPVPVSRTVTARLRQV